MGGIVLVVDDNPELLDGVKLTLEMEDFQVLIADSGAAALEILGRITPDLILADIMMPVMDGYELYQHIHDDPRWVHVPFIFVTAKTAKEDIRKGKEMGVDDYITKPFDPQDVVAAVRGKLKRMAELTGRPVPGDVMGNLKYLWGSKIGPVPVPLIGLLVLALVMLGPLLFVRARNQARFEEPLRPDVNEMIMVDAGIFLMGGDAAGTTKPREVNVPAFQIDKYEVTVEQYKIFVDETKHAAPWGTYPEALRDHPITNVSWEDAAAYCQWAGKRLPTES